MILSLTATYNQDKRYNMELLSTTYEVLGQNKDESVRVKFMLASVPTPKWTNVFNNHTATVKSIKNTNTLILVDKIENIKSVDVVGSIKVLISIVDNEVMQDSNKELTLKSFQLSGKVIAHDSLSYNSFNGISQYQQFISKISNNHL